MHFLCEVSICIELKSPHENYTFCTVEILRKECDTKWQKFLKLRVRREMHTGANITVKTASEFSRRTRSGVTATPKKSRLVMVDIGKSERLRLLKARCPAMVAELLDIGERSAIPSSYLCKILGISRRQLTREIEKERRSGAFICASGSGYFLAENTFEFRCYLRTLESRARELDTTRSALIAAAGRMGVAGF